MSGRVGPAAALANAATTQAGQAAQARQAAQADQADQADQEDQAVTTVTATANGAGQTTQSGQALEAPAPQGGGAQGALVTGSGRPAPSVGRGGVTVTTNNGRLEKLVIKLDGDRKLIKKRPAATSDQAHFWRWIETQYFKAKRCKADSDALGEIQAIVARQRPGSARAASGGGGSSSGRLATPLDQGTGERVLTFQLDPKPLQAHVLSQIEGRFYLRVVEELSTPDGKPFVPGPGKRGSLMGQFPHMVLNRRDVESEHPARRYPTFYCGADRLLGVRVELMEKREGASPVRASEHDLLKLVRSQFNHGEQAKHDFFQKSLVVYISLEFAEGPQAGKAVSAAAFKRTPDNNALFLPAESAPYCGGSTEKEVVDGRASFTKLKLAQVSEKNVRDEVAGYPYRIAVHTLNPWLNDKEGFTAYSSPFFVMVKLHNNANSGEHYVGSPSGVPVAYDMPPRVRA